MDKRYIVLRGILFCVFLMVILVNIEKIFFNTASVCDTWADIQDPLSENPEVLFVDNSHIYTSINPDIIEQAMGIKAEILGSASQNIEMTLSNLEIALKYKAPDYIILEANAIFSNNMEELVREKRGYIINNFDGVNNYILKGKALSNILPIDYLPEGMFQLFRPMETWKRWENLKWKLEHPEEEKSDLGYKRLDKLQIINYDKEHALKQKRLYCNAISTNFSQDNEVAFRKILEITNEKKNTNIYKSVVAYDNMVPVVSGCLRI